MANKIPVKKINPLVQAHHLKILFPESQAHVERGVLTWVAELVPSPLSKKYKVRVIYRLGDSPKINVINPVLHVPKGQRLPHTYPGEKLCLYYPRASEWRGDMLLSQTIVPWMSEWLLHYEIWLATGSWCAGGIHPTVKESADR